ncbi:MAG: hypothetical protein ACU0BS_03745 [Hasllibacter sp.]
MGTIREFRRHAGRWRDRLIHGRRDRRLAREAERVGAALAPLLGELPPTPAPPRSGGCEVHMLCGEGQAVMGRLASWSLLRFGGGLRLVVHSDGTLDPRTAEGWRATVPGMRIARPEESLAAARATLAGHPRVLDWTERYHFGAKLGGFYGLARSDRLIELDSDVLTFARPDALLEAVADPRPTMAWNRDQIYAYAHPAAVLERVLGDLVPRGLPDRLNAGYLASFRFGPATWDRLETALERLDRDPRTDPLRFWTHQTLLAVVAAGPEAAAAGPLPPIYDMHRGPTRPHAPMRHYPGAPGTRPRFFVEGVRRIVEEGLESGALPAAFDRPVLRRPA